MQDQRAQDMVEYAFLAALIALAVVAGLNQVACGLNMQYSNIGTQISSS